jgi:flagellar motility protein MotE (MotC chaperone)
MKFLQAPITAMLLGGVAFLLTMFALIQKPLIESSKPRELTEEEKRVDFWQRHDPEVDQLLQEITKEKELLAKRATELKELETRLAAERAELNQVTQRVAQVQQEFDQTIVRIKEEETPNLKKLAKLYMSMSAEGASAIFRELDDQVVVKLLTVMKEDQSAPLLEAMTRQGEEQAKRAASLAEALRKATVDKKKSP